MLCYNEKSAERVATEFPPKNSLSFSSAAPAISSSTSDALGGGGSLKLALFKRGQKRAVNNRTEPEM